MLFIVEKTILYRDIASNIILIAFTIAGVIQYIRYIEVQELDSNFLGGIYYTTGIPLVNATCTTVITTYVIRAYWKQYWPIVKSHILIPIGIWLMKFELARVCINRLKFYFSVLKGVK